jgi:hypothetical protein
MAEQKVQAKKNKKKVAEFESDIELKRIINLYCNSKQIQMKQKLESSFENSPFPS